MNERIIYNLCSVYCYIIVVLLFFASPHAGHSWDLAVASDGALNFFDMDGNIQYSPVETQQFTDLYALAYDPIHQLMFFSVNEHNTSIYTFNLLNRNLTPIVPRQDHEVQGIAYDTLTNMLFWTDGNGHSIWNRSLIDDSTSPEILLELNDQIPMGITISFCQRLLFWANSNHLSGSIDRSNLDGTDHQKIITKDLYQPLGITVDEPYGKIYWTDDQPGIYYRIERSNFDGSDRELVIRRTHQEPFAIAALNNAIYWTDTIQGNVWMLSSDMSFPNHTKAKLEPDLFHHYKKYVPNGIVAFSNGTFDCDAILKVPTQKPEVAYSDQPSDPGFPTEYCLNSGDYHGEKCKCKKGFSGKRCEVSVCYNYCLNGGQCYLDEFGFAECRCLPGYRGSRCETDACDDYCLNGGRCHVNESIPLCTCGSGYFGQRCEGVSDRLCETICSDSPQSSLCDCDLLKSKYDVVNDKLQWPGATCEDQRIVIISLTCFSASAMLVVVFLTRKVCVLRRRPRIKKRIIVNKGVKSQTPLTARPHPSSPTEQCEITIENCCNMNICETPCFEPNLRSPRSTSSSLTKKTEDRRNLLNNMEEEPGGSDCPYS